MKIKFIALISILILLLIVIPTGFAADNETIISVDEDSTDSFLEDNNIYYDSSIEFNNGNGSKDNPYKDFSSYISDNSVIHLSNGNYTFKNSLNVNNITFSGEDALNTIINGNGKRLTIDGIINFSNVTLTNFAILNYGSLNATNTVFTKLIPISTTKINNAYGGAICNYYSISSSYIDNCTFYDNFAVYGGAIYNNGGNLVILNSVFENNSANAYGGAIACESGSVIINNTKFINSKSKNDAGGAIYIKSGNLNANNTVILNSTSTFGAAITALNSNLNLNQFIGINNTVNYDGGVIYIMYGTLLMNNSYLINNSANNGAVLFIDDTVNSLIENNTFENNSAEVFAGAIYSILNTNITFKNNIYKNNVASIYDDLYNSSEINMFISNGNYTMYMYNSTEIIDLPIKYNLADNGFVTSVKDQGSGGNCWSFATIAVLESCILKASGEYLDLSEENMKNLFGKYSDYGWTLETNGGGYASFGYNYLISWLGPVYDSSDSYNPKSTLSSVINSIMHVQNVLFIERKSFEDNEGIKKAIMQYGAVYSPIFSSFTGNKQYYNGTMGANHAITIVGWDDTLEFNGAPDKGGWIIKNSWGASSGDKGYYYVSYYDVTCAPIGKIDSIFTFILNDTVKYDKNYQYDIPGKTDYFFNDSSIVWYKNKFISTDDEYLSAVSTYFQKVSDYTIFVYVNGVLKHTQSGSSNIGYYTINLNKFIQLNSEDIFEIVFKISTNGNAGFPISEIISLNKLFYNENISFLSYDGENWVDLYDLKWNYSSHTYNSQVACIKAFTIYNPINTTTNISINFNNGFNIQATVLNQYGHPVSGGNVIFNVNGKNYTVSVINGIAILNLNYIPQKYIISAIFNNEGYVSSKSQNNTFNLIQTIISSDYTNTLNSKYQFKLFDGYGNPLTSTNLAITIGSKVYKLTSDKNGIVNLNIDLNPGNYIIKITNPLTNEVKSQNIKVVSRLTENKNINMYYGAGSTYKVKVFDDNGNIAKGVNVKFTVNGKSYTRTTDSKGYASFKISLNPGTYTITAEYKGFKVSNKITVKPTIKTKDITVKKGKTIKFTAKLYSSKGKILKNKKIKFKFKGKTYKVKTNKKGIATLKIVKKYKVGKYTIKSTYGKLTVKNTIRIKK